MNKSFFAKYLSRPKWAVSAMAVLLGLASAHSVHAINLAQSPLFLAQPVTPIVMLNMSNDHQLFFKAYDDYSDLDGDGSVDTTYMNDYDYYGYFDSLKCYSYSSGVFTPAGTASNYYCDGSKWSGNFLNWATMTRIDTVRKILYGGKRWSSGDSANYTVLERAMLPQDAHSFAKYYNGSDLNRLTPFNVTSGSPGTAATGITICNTTEPGQRSQQSQNVNAPPLMQVARGNYSLWASNEGYQCRWGEGSNDNTFADSGLYAYSESPTKNGAGLGNKDYAVRVEVCNPNHLNETNNEKCTGYPSGGFKPTGLLQDYGADDTIHFGLITGSYTLNKSGGVLRKNVGSMSDEVNATNGTFLTPADGLGIVGTLNALRISRYSFSSGQYNSSDSCPWEMASFNDGVCTNWGNPQSEIYLESLRYLAGKSANFAADDRGKIPGLGVVNWNDPIDNDNYCAPLSIIQFNASTSSYDSDQLGGFSDIANGKTLSALTNDVGAAELAADSTYFVGETGSNADQLCTAKSISNLSDVKGTCPDAPRLGGSYQIAGLAYHARVNGIANDRETVQTFGVALAPAVPRIVIPVPGGNGSVSLQPACRNTTTSPDANCAIVDFKVIEQDHTGSTYRGKLYVNWEDSEQGGDFDQDMWGVINYAVTDETAKIRTRVVAQSTPNSMGFGYVISGTTKDGFHAHSGINNFVYNNPIEGALTCTSWGNNQCDCRDSYKGRCTSDYADASTQVFELGESSAKALEQPLYYAAKWGGFKTEDENGEPVTVPPAGEPENYFFATNPRELEASLIAAVDQIVAGSGSATAVATTSTSLGTDAVAYQANFNTLTWTGDLTASPIGEQNLGVDTWSAASNLPAPNARNLWTHNGTEAVEFEWGNLNPVTQQAVLDADDDLGEERVRWTRGEEIPGFNERGDNEVLGDIVNSNPKVSGTENYGFARSAASGSGQPYTDFVDGKTLHTVFVGANDGMLHAFNAETGRERFAYIPYSVYEQLKLRTDNNYGSSFNPHKYSVDGQIFVGDAYVNGSWKTILVGTLGAGGKGIFALDVTNATDLSDTRVLFDYHQGNAPQIGNITGTPIIAPMPDGSWAIVTGNGYNSEGGESQLVIIPLDGTYTPQYIATGNAGNNGLSEPAISVGGGFLARYAYAGDLQGKMYKFNLETKAVEYELFTAVDGENAQPITASPVLGINPYRKNASGQPSTMVYFGTGSYLTFNDLGNTDLQSFYGIADSGQTVTRAELFVKDISSQSGGARTLYEGDGPYGDEIDWVSKAGWVLDWDEVAGERVVDKPILSYDRVIFPTVIPTSNPCDYGGNSWIMALIGVGGLYPGYNPLEPIEPTDPNDPPGEPPGGIEEDKIVKLTDPTKDGAPCGGEPFIIQQNSDGTTEYVCTGEPSMVEGRQSWRQLQ